MLPLEAFVLAVEVLPGTALRTEAKLRTASSCAREGAVVTAGVVLLGARLKATTDRAQPGRVVTRSGWLHVFLQGKLLPVEPRKIASLLQLYDASPNAP